jgi:hypothetical protein
MLLDRNRKGYIIIERTAVTYSFQLGADSGSSDDQHPTLIMSNMGRLIR